MNNRKTNQMSTSKDALVLSKTEKNEEEAVSAEQKPVKSTEFERWLIAQNLPEDVAKRYVSTIHAIREHAVKNHMASKALFEIDDNDEVVEECKRLRVNSDSLFGNQGVYNSQNHIVKCAIEKFLEFNKPKVEVAQQPVPAKEEKDCEPQIESDSLDCNDQARINSDPPSDEDGIANMAPKNADAEENSIYVSRNSMNEEKTGLNRSEDENAIQSGNSFKDSMSKTTSDLTDVEDDEKKRQQRIRENRVAFIKWMQNKGIEPNTIVLCLSDLKRCTKIAKNNGTVLDDAFCVCDALQMKEIFARLEADKRYILLNKRLKGSFEFALKKYIEYCEEEYGKNEQLENVDQDKLDKPKATSFVPNMKVIVDHIPTLAHNCLFSQARQSEFFGIPYRQTFCVFREFYARRDDQQCVYEKTGKCPYLLPLEIALKQGGFEGQINE